MRIEQRVIAADQRIEDAQATLDRLRKSREEALLLGRDGPTVGQVSDAERAVGTARREPGQVWPDLLAQLPVFGLRTVASGAEVSRGLQREQSV